MAIWKDAQAEEEWARNLQAEFQAVWDAMTPAQREEWIARASALFASIALRRARDAARKAGES